MKMIISISFCLSAIMTFSQNALSQQKPNEQIFVNINSSGGGSGDVRGVFANLGYQKYFKRKISWYAEFGANTHDQEKCMTYTIGNAPTKDASLRFITSGMQLGGGFGYSPLWDIHEIQLKVGTIFRYQSSSVTGYSIYFPLETSFPFPATVFDNNEKMRTYSVGYKLNVSYSYAIKKKYLLGLHGFFQNDTNADTFFGYGLMAGIRF